MSSEFNSEDCFDLSYLNQVFQGNQQMINQIISLFIKQVPDYIHQMNDCVVKCQFDLLHPLAHKAKSSIAMLGLKSLENTVLEIEKLSKEGQNEKELSVLVEDALTECHTVTVQLSDVIKD